MKLVRAGSEHGDSITVVRYNSWRLSVSVVLKQERWLPAYLTQLYLENQLSQNKFRIGGRTISLSDIRAPLFVLGTETDHVAPWKSVYKIHQLTQGEMTFTLTSGGHNAGVVSGPEHPRRRYRAHTLGLCIIQCVARCRAQTGTTLAGRLW